MPINGARSSERPTVPKSDIGSLEATTETLENEYEMSKLERSIKDVASGRMRNASEFLKEL